ncbi:MAG: haloacid dehalogenase-like hydrolase [Marinosulfonomonas sp.]
MTEPNCSSVLFVDLDGTLILDNSFHTFVRVLAIVGGRRTRSALFRALVLRLLGRYSGGHASMKRRVLEVYSAEPETTKQTVITQSLQRMSGLLSRPALDYIAAWRAVGAQVVLATAAPDCYAKPLAHQLGFDDCLATASTIGPNWQELLAECKAQACSDWLMCRGIIPAARIGVLTDHKDDVPLLRMATEAAIQCSGASFSEIVKAVGALPVLEHIDIVSAQHGGGIWFWFDDKPCGPIDDWEARTILSKHRYAMLYVEGDGWRSIRHGRELVGACRRVDCPRPPSTKTRVFVSLKRRIVRDGLGIFH